MRFHDFHLEGYSVSKNGTEIILDLVYDYTGRPRETSRIQFTEVAAYHFVHTGGAIITEIEQWPLASLLAEIGDQLSAWRRLHGGYGEWDGSPAGLQEYARSLEDDGFKAWRIESAIGFRGFTVAKDVQELP